MNLSTAHELLEIHANMSLEEMKRQYKRKALRYHPDKNKSADAADRFREIHEAYQTVLRHYSGDHGCDTGAEGTTYKDMLFSFLSHFFTETPQDGGDTIFTVKVRMIFSRLLCMCESKAADYLSKLDTAVLRRISDFIRQYREIFHFTDSFLETIERILSTAKTTDEECLLLNPFLEDLMEHNLYRFTRNGTVYLVPLWHHELVYDSSGSEFMVRCCPVLPEHIEIDADNNLYVYLDYDIREIWGKSTVEVIVGGKTVSFEPCQLKFTNETQILKYEDCGISRMNMENVFDIAVKQSIVLKIQLWLNCNT